MYGNLTAWLRSSNTTVEISRGTHAAQVIVLCFQHVYQWLGKKFNSKHLFPVLRADESSGLGIEVYTFSAPSQHRVIIIQTFIYFLQDPQAWV